MKEMKMWAIYSPQGGFFRTFANREGDLCSSFLAKMFEARFFEEKKDAESVLKQLLEKKEIEEFFRFVSSEKLRSSAVDSYRVVQIDFYSND